MQSRRRLTKAILFSFRPHVLIRRLARAIRNSGETLGERMTLPQLRTLLMMQRPEGGRMCRERVSDEMTATLQNLIEHGQKEAPKKKRVLRIASGGAT